MPYIKLKGINQFYTIKSDQANSLNKMFMDKTIPTDHKFNIGPLTFTKSQIQLIDATPEGRNEGADKMADKFREWNEFWNKLVKRTPEEKAEYNREAIYQFIQYAISGEFKGDWKNDKEKAIKFFEENPNRTLCDWRIWFDTKPQALSPTDETQNKADTRLFSLRMLETQIAEDLRMEKYYFGKQENKKVENIPEVETMLPPEDEIDVNSIPF